MPKDPDALGRGRPESTAGGTFKDYIAALDMAGYVSVGLRPAVEKIKDRGNAANHDLPASSEADSLVTLKITEPLLRGIYETPDCERWGNDQSYTVVFTGFFIVDRSHWAS